MTAAHSSARAALPVTNDKHIVDIASLAAEIRGRPDWLTRLDAHRNAATLPKDPLKEFEALLPLVREELARGKSALALAACRVACFCAPAKFISIAKRRGVFRASKVRFNNSGITWLVSNLAHDAGHLGLPPDATSYLHSVGNLLRLAPAALELRRSIITEARKVRPFSLIKSCLVFVDRAFRPAADHLPSEEEQAAVSLGHPTVFSPEEKASGLSTLVAVLRETDLIDGFDLAMVHEAAVVDGTCERMLATATELSELTQAEELLDNFPFECVVVDERRNEIHVRAIDPALEKSIRLGYVMSMMQSHITRMSSNEFHADHPSLSALADRFSKELGHALVTRTEWPVDHYVMALPLSPPLKRMVTEDAMYKEEAAYLSLLARESYADLVSVWDSEVVDGVKVKDLTRLMRFFHLISRVFFDALDRPAFPDDRDILDMRSRLPVYEEKVLRMLFTELFGEVVSAKLLDLLTYDVSTDGFFDLQYRPLIKIGTHFVVPMGVLTGSDLVRNTLYQQSTRLLVGKGADPMQAAVAKALESRGFRVKCDLKYKLNGTPGDIDILACKDGLLLAFECKNTFHPCNAHEMRSTWEHMRKAGSQLTRAVHWLESPGVVGSVFSNLGWGVPDVEQIKTGIVSAIRIFGGYQIEGHPIRQAHELINVIQAGVVQFSRTDRFRFWNGEEFSLGDLLAYLDGSVLIKERFDSMVAGGRVYKLGAKASLVISSYGLDTMELSQRIATRYPRLDPDPIASPSALEGQSLM